MSTLAEYTAAAKDYANTVRARKTKEGQYATVYAQLQTLLAAEDVKRETLITTAQGLASDVP